MMSGTPDKEIAKTPLLFLCQSMGFQGTEVEQKWVGPDKVEASSNVYSKVAHRQESCEWMVEVIYEYDIGVRN